jgi:5'-nucleotidase
MRILATNDDGIEAPGLWAMVHELQGVGDVRVVAPRQEKSGAGTSISLRRPIHVEKVAPHPSGIESYAVEGTPGDGVIIAIRALFPGETDLVVSGINRGLNIGSDVYVSGTVGAAMQAYLHGVTALAISVDGYHDVNFSVAAKLAAVLAAKFRDRLLPERILLNANLPNVSLAEIGGVEVTSLSKQTYCDTVLRDEGEGDTSYRIVHCEDFGQGGVGSDLWALQTGRISLTRLPDGLPSEALLHRLQALAPTIHSELHGLT